MKPFEINVRITVGAEAALMELLQRLAGTGAAPLPNSGERWPKDETRMEAEAEPAPLPNSGEGRSKAGTEKAPLPNSGERWSKDETEKAPLPNSGERWSKDETHLTAAPVKAEAAPVKAEAAPVKAEAAPVKAEAAPVKADSKAGATFTEVDVRAAMERTRKRIEGENYRENTDGEGYRTWHRRLTGWFKGTAALLGAEKPSALADSESRRKFIEACDGVRVEGDELSNELPF